jgi:DNA-binding MarR family transcriptional regulator
MALTDDKPLSLVHMLSNRISRAFFDEVETKYGVSLTEWRVILTLISEPGVSGADITNRWAMEKMAVNRATRRLVDDGHVARTRDPDDRRSYRLALTSKGTKLHDKIAPTANKRYAELISSAPREELDAMVATLQTMIARAEELN